MLKITFYRLFSWVFEILEGNEWQEEASNFVDNVFSDSLFNGTIA